MVKSIVLPLMVLLSCSLFAQKEEVYFNPGLLRASATIAPSRMLENKASSIYLDGFLEYLVDNKYSLRGDIYQFIDARYDANSIRPDYMSRLFFGTSRYFGKRNWQSYIGLQTGLTYTYIKDNTVSYSHSNFSPSYSVKIGTTFYIWKYFHFFADVSYINSNLRALRNGPVRMDEIIFSAGLGFQFNTKKKHRTYRIPGTPSFK